MNSLLTRDEFRNEVKKRDNYRCVNCGVAESNIQLLDAHHIIERRLWVDGGYYLNNGATLCDPRCHMLAESTELSVRTIRELCHIQNIILPSHFYIDNEYDKWGNIILPNGRRAKGELFFDKSVQKSLERGNLNDIPILKLFDNYVKYPRTYHLPWSPGRSKDDRTLENDKCFKDKRVVVTIKMDGENISLYKDYFHARSLENNSHASQTYVRNTHSKIAYDIPDGWRIVGENLYAYHSIRYEDLENYFYIISIWNEKNICLPWDETKEYAEYFELPIVKSFYDGIYNQKEIHNHFVNNLANKHEGYVIRVANEFPYGSFRSSVAKYVRTNHVQETVHNWRTNWYPSDLTINKKK